MRHLKRLYEFTEQLTADADEIKFMSWIYLLGRGGYKTEGFAKKGWHKSDKRMDGMSVVDAMEDGIKRGMVKLDGDKWFITEKGDKAVVDFFLRDTEDEVDKLCADLEKKCPRSKSYDYRISDIPDEMYQDLKKSNWRSKLKYEDTDLTNEDYHVIKRFLDVYQRDSNLQGKNVKKYAGHINELCEDKDYVLYRGINYHRTEQQFKPGDKIKSTRDVQSWSTDKHVAKQFAYGNPTPMQVTLKKHRFEGAVDVILKHTFKPADVIIDFVYVDEMNPHLKDDINWTSEAEVIIRCKPSAEFEVFEVI